MVLRPMLFAVRRLALVAIVALVCGTAVFLPFAGRFLVREDPLVHADAICVLDGTRAERWMEAVDLYKAGYAPVIVLSPGRTEDAELILRSRGIRYPSNAALARDAMVQMGIDPSAIVIPDASVDNTAQEAEMMRSVAHARGWHNIVMITSKYHSRRAGFAFRRELRGSGITVSVRTTKYDVSDPAHWWRRRPDVRFVVSELQKLVLYRVGIGG